MLRYAVGSPSTRSGPPMPRPNRCSSTRWPAARDVTLDPEILTIGVARRVPPPTSATTSSCPSPTSFGRSSTRSAPSRCSTAARPIRATRPARPSSSGSTPAARELAGDVTVVYLEDYGMSLAALLVAGVDVWLNNPVAPYEASGTSGMKAAAQRRPQPQCPRRLVGRRMGRGCHRLGHRRRPGRARTDVRIGDPVVDAADARRAPPSAGGSGGPRSTTERPDAFARRPPLRHGLERLLLHRTAHGGRVRGPGLPARSSP